MKRAALRLLRWMSCDHFRHWSQLSPGFSATGICCCYAREQVAFSGLTATFYQSEQLLVGRAVAGALAIWIIVRNVLNGMASRRPRLDALRDSWYRSTLIMTPSEPASGSFIRG